MTSTNLIIRRAARSDFAAVERLAELDSSSPPTGDILLAEMDDELWAAVAVESGKAVADPFRPSGDLVELLRFRAEGMRGGAAGERRSLARPLPRAA